MGLQNPHAHSPFFGAEEKNMKIRTIVNLTEAQKARIVSRNEPFPQRICTFEMSPEKAEIISRLKGNYKIESGLDGVVIQATDDQYSYGRLQVEEIKDTNYKVAQEKIMLQDVLAEAYAAGTVTEGGNIDFALDIMALALQHREAILQHNEEVTAEKGRKEEEERPAKEAQARKEAQEKAERDRIEAEEKARKDAEDRARNETIESEKEAWIEENGSERLRKGYATGYNCTKIYEIERAQFILGSEYIRDSNEVEEKDRSCPSLEALQEVERLKQVIEKGAAIVWLPYGLSGEDEIGCEAVKADPGTFSRYWFYRVF
jgi:hypothetical protein